MRIKSICWIEYRPLSEGLQNRVSKGFHALPVNTLFNIRAESEGSARYYIGELKPIVGSQQAVKVEGKNAVSIEFELDQAVPQKLYQHLIQ